MVPQPSLTWVHVSDLHFGHGDAHYHFDQVGVTNALLRDVEGMCKRLGPPDLLVVTGDIAFSGQAAQYAQATEWLRALHRKLGGCARILVVPGNHDIDRKQGSLGNGKLLHAGLRSDPRLLDELLRDPEQMKAIWPKLQAYSDFARDIAGCTIDSFNPFWMQEISLPLFPGKIIACGLNTALQCFNDKDSPTTLRLGRGQLLKTIEQQPSDVLLLILQHHPPDWLSDGREEVRQLEQRAHVLFSGHVHQQQGIVHSTFISGTRLHLIAGASHADSEEAGCHAYAWGRLDSYGLAYYSRVWAPALGAFAPAVMLDANEFKRDDHAFMPRERLPRRLADWLPVPKQEVSSAVEFQTIAPKTAADQLSPTEAPIQAAASASTKILSGFSKQPTASVLKKTVPLPKYIVFIATIGFILVLIIGFLSHYSVAPGNYQIRQSLDASTNHNSFKHSISGPSSVQDLSLGTSRHDMTAPVLSSINDTKRGRKLHESQTSKAIVSVRVRVAGKVNMPMLAADLDYLLSKPEYVRQHELNACYTRFLHRKPNLTGTLIFIVDFGIFQENGSPQVKDVSFMGGTLGEEQSVNIRAEKVSLSECVKKTIRNWRLSGREGRTYSNVIINLILDFSIVES